MAKQDDAALKLLRWELEGHGEAVLAAMLRHPDKSLADAVEMIEQEIKALSPKDPMSELPMPSVPRGRASSERKAKSTFVMHLPVGRLVVMTGADASIAALFRRAPGKDVVSVLTKTVEAIEENQAAATRTFGNEKLAGKYAEALLKLLQKTSL